MRWEFFVLCHKVMGLDVRAGDSGQKRSPQDGLSQKGRIVEMILDKLRRRVYT